MILCCVQHTQIQTLTPKVTNTSRHKKYPQTHTLTQTLKANRQHTHTKYTHMHTHKNISVDIFFFMGGDQGDAGGRSDFENKAGAWSVVGRRGFRARSDFRN